MEKELKRKIQVATAQKKFQQKSRKILQTVNVDELGRKICRVEPRRPKIETEYSKSSHISTLPEESRRKIKCLVNTGPVEVST